MGGQPAPAPEDDDGNSAGSEDGGGAVASTPSVATLVRFALPCFLSALTGELMSIADTSVVGAISTHDLASLAPAALIADTATYSFWFLNIATTSLVATALARGSTDKAFRTATDSLLLSTVAGLAVAVAVAIIAKPALALMLSATGGEDVLASALAYLRIRLLGIPCVLMTCAASASLQATRDSMSPLLAITGGAVANLALDIWLCLRLGWGVAGAAYATVTCQAIEAVVLLAALQRKRAALAPRCASLSLFTWPSRRTFRRFVDFAGPIFFVIQGKILAYNALTLAVAASGSISALAGHQVLATIFFTCSMVGDGLTQTVQAFLPASLDASGRATPATRELSRRAFKTAAAGGVLCGAVAFAIAKYGGRIFTQDVAVLAHVAGVAPILWMLLTVQAIMMTGEGILLAMRDLPHVLRIYAQAIGVHLAALAVVRTQGGGLVPTWWVLLGFLIFRNLRFLSRSAHLGAVPQRWLDGSIGRNSSIKTWPGQHRSATG